MAAEVPLTEEKECGIIPELRLGKDLILKYPYRKGGRTYTEKIVRVCDGIVYMLDPATKDQIPVGQALMVGDVLVIAMTVQKE